MTERPKTADGGYLKLKPEMFTTSLLWWLFPEGYMLAKIAAKHFLGIMAYLYVHFKGQLEAWFNIS